MTSFRPSYRKALVRNAESYPYVDAGILSIETHGLFDDVNIPAVFGGSMMNLYDRQDTVEGKLLVEENVRRFLEAAEPKIPFVAARFSQTEHSDGRWLVHAYPDFDTVCGLKEQANLFRKFTSSNGHAPKKVALGIVATELAAQDIAEILNDHYVSPQSIPVVTFGIIEPSSR